MSKARIEPIRLSDSDGSLLEACHDWWRDEGGVVSASSERMQELFSHIQFASDDPAAWPPPFLHVGTETDLAQLFGRDFAKSAAGGHGVPDAEAENNINPVYRVVSNLRKPSIDVVTVNVSAHWGQVRCSYERLVLPARLKNGKSLFLTATHMRRMLSVVGDNGQTEEHRI